MIFWMSDTAIGRSLTMFPSGSLEPTIRPPPIPPPYPQYALPPPSVQQQLDLPYLPRFEAGLLFGVTEGDIAALAEDEFAEVWTALGKVARARARKSQQPASQISESTDESEVASDQN